MIPKALWLKRNDPQIYDKAHRICEYQDFLTYKLTGDWAASLNNVGLRWHYRNDSGGWPESLVSALGMADLLEKWPRRVVAPGQVIGTLTGAAADALGLRRSVKVVQGGADALIGMIGLGVS
jgi:ribulose kinase